MWKNVSLLPFIICEYWAKTLNFLLRERELRALYALLGIMSSDQFVPFWISTCLPNLKLISSTRRGQPIKHVDGQTRQFRIHFIESLKVPFGCCIHNDKMSPDLCPAVLGVTINYALLDNLPFALEYDLKIS